MPIDNCPSCDGFVSWHVKKWAVHIKCGQPFMASSNGPRALTEADIACMDSRERTTLAEIMRIDWAQNANKG